MIKTRVIPVLLRRGQQLVKGKQFNSWRSVGLAKQAILIHQQRNVDELVVLDIDATPSGKAPDIEFNKQLTMEAFMPITIGGGIKTEEQARATLQNGADKVVVGSSFITRPHLVREIAKRHGNQSVTVAIDVKDHRVHYHCGKHSISTTAVDAAKAAEDAGAGEILLTAIDRDGMMCGYDLELIDEVASAVRVPVIAAGGCGTPQHMADALSHGAHAVAAGAMFLFSDTTPRSAAQWLAARGHSVRLS